MNNESYKRLAKYSVQLNGKTNKSITMINLLINRLIETMVDESIESKFKSIGFKDGKLD